MIAGCLRVLRVLFLFVLAASVLPGVQLLADKPIAAEPVRTLRGHADRVRTLAFSPDGKVLATGGFDGVIRLWDVASGQERASFRGHDAAGPAPADRTLGISSIAFFPDGKILAIGGLDGTIGFWDVAERRPLRTLRQTGPVLCIAIAPDGKTLASAGEDRVVRLWDAAAGSVRRMLGGHTMAVEGLTFDADGQMLISCSRDGTVRLWDPVGGAPAGILRLGSGVLSVAASSDGKSLAAGFAGGPVTLWSMGANIERRVLEGHGAGVVALVFAPGARIMASASQDGTLKLWDVGSGRRLAALEAHAQGVWALSFSPDGKLLASGGEDRTAKIWDVGKARALAAPASPWAMEEPPRALEPQSGEIEAVAGIKRLGGRYVGKGWRAAWSPDGKRIAFSKTDARGWPNPVLTVIDLETGKLTELVGWGKDPAWSPGDGKFIAYAGTGHGSEEEIWIIESGGGTPRKIAKGGFPAWSPDGKTLFFHSHDKRKLISVDPFGKEPEGAKEVLDVPDLYPAISPIAKRLAYPQGNTAILVVDWGSGKTLRTWSTAQTGTGGWSPDGQQLAIGIADPQASGGSGLWVLNVETGRGVRVAAGPIAVPAWSPDGSKVAFDLRLASGWEIWMIQTKAFDHLQPIDLPRDRYTVPEGGVAELLKFIEDLRTSQPRTAQELSSHSQRAPSALAQAAERILKLEKDTKSTAYQTALRVRLSAMRTAGDPQRQRETFSRLKEFLSAKAGAGLSREDALLILSTAQGFEQGGQAELAAEAYRGLVEAIGKGPDERLAEITRMAEGAARRVALVGKELELEGVKLDGGPLDWAAYRGKTVLVFFWTSWCPWDRPELALARKHLGLYRDRGFDVVGVNLDANRQQLDRFLQTERVPWASLYAEGAGFKHPMALRYGVTAVPTMFLVGKDGKVVSIRARGPELDRLLERLLGPAVRPKGNLTPIDFQSKANRRLDEKFGRIEGNDLRELPQGEQVLGGVKFKIGPAALFLAGAKYREVPEKVEGIAVDKAFARLYILHAAAWADAISGAPDGTEIGEYVLHYEDGAKQAIPIVCGEDVRNWSNAEGGKPVSRGKVLWTGANAATRRGQLALYLYLTTWENPHPEKKVRHIDYVSNLKTQAAPFCVAMTAEEPVQAGKPAAP